MQLLCSKSGRCCTASWGVSVHVQHRRGVAVQQAGELLDSKQPGSCCCTSATRVVAIEPVGELLCKKSKLRLPHPPHQLCKVTTKQPKWFQPNWFQYNLAVVFFWEFEQNQFFCKTISTARPNWFAPKKSSLNSGLTSYTPHSKALRSRSQRKRPISGWPQRASCVLLADFWRASC